MLRPECEPAHCTGCGVEICCGEVCRDLSYGTGRARRLRCGRGKCATGVRLITYYCSKACYWRHRRARLRKPVEPRRCQACGVRFTPRHSHARTCSNACRQALYRRPRLGPWAENLGPPTTQVFRDPWFPPEFFQISNAALHKKPRSVSRGTGSAGKVAGCHADQRRSCICSI